MTRPAAHSMVGGESFVAAGAEIPVINPFTEQPMGRATEAGAEIVDRAVRDAHRAYAAWRGIAVEERAALLERVADLLARDEEEMAALVTSEMGMPITLSRVTQAQLPASVLRATAQVARDDFGWREEVDGATLIRSGAGVVGAITPWNMPVHQIIAKVAAAVVAGSTVVLKASEQTPYDATRVAELFLEAGAPEGLLNVVTGTGPVTGAALAAHPLLTRLSFTGSVRAGREVAALAARELTRTALELGGKSPALLLDDVDLARAVPAALTNGLVNSGQACNAPTRMLVPANRLDEVLDLVREAANRFVLGDPTDEDTNQGPLVTARQQASVLARIERAQAQGGRLVIGTGRPSERTSTGFFVDPTVIVGLEEDAEAVREEIFGPVVVLQPYADEAEAIRIANDSDYGLSAEVWSGDDERALAVAEMLSVGQVKINGVRTRNRPLVPFGGMRNSGYGRELGPLGIEEFTDVTAVMA
ncbi:aldehyde dehydrogenase family protein [Nocardioides sp. AE5]|uniref:aldehyde dehydrogenase family protein n=1 Tax=Nocardioides sp. AE5 TaxID=2962573 RepID=UPI002881FE55|nr:aldehyde dehydrogenase family protein [Nocardioides sp. AE5]MDT0201661.1 aldehyde dehydrogenase family protein [Nocardioides sp. AE5]